MQELIDGMNSLMSMYLLIPALLFAGIFFSIKTKFVQFTYFKEMLRLLTEGATDKTEGISSFQAFTVSLGSRVGTGNMAGVALAIVAGGAGAVFWMWIIALIGAASAFAESTLAQIYKEKESGGTFKGGPAYYMQNALKSRKMGIAFAILITLCYGFVFNAVQSNTISSAFQNSFALDQNLMAGVLVFFTGLIIFGGIRRIAKFTNIVVPFMAVLYLLVVFYVLLINFTEIPGLLIGIIEQAFGLKEAVGGSLGAALAQGIKRGLFSNEAGMGSAPNAAATADVTHPVKQGLIQALGVFTDTMVICTATALLILIAGGHGAGTADGIQLTQLSLESEVGTWGSTFVACCIFLFAFSSVIGNYYYGESNIRFISDKPRNILLYRLAVLGMVIFGSIASSTVVWGLADITMIAMALLNLYAIVRLSKIVVLALRDYREKRKKGIPLTFKAQDIGVESDTTCWD